MSKAVPILSELRSATRCILPLLKKMKKTHRIEIGANLHDLFHKIAHLVTFKEKPKRIHRVIKGKKDAINER